MIREIAKKMREEKIIHNSMVCTYMLITKVLTVKELFESNKDFGLLFHPDDLEVLTGNQAIDIIDTLIEYFVELEDYEKCSDLVEVKKDYL